MGRNNGSLPEVITEPLGKVIVSELSPRYSKNLDLLTAIQYIKEIVSGSSKLYDAKDETAEE